MGGLDILIAGAACVPAVWRARQLGVVNDCISYGCLSQPAWWACIGGIAANYFMHAFIWKAPNKFSALCKQQPLKSLGTHPVDVFASLEVVAKIVQACSILTFLGKTGRSSTWTAISSAPMWCWGALAAAVGAGQALNFATYNAIGNAGVYYGFKLGRDVPWCYGFPFNTGIRHPQYLGVVLTLWGTLPVLVSTELGKKGLIQLIMVWSAMYIPISLMEQSDDNDTDDK